MPPVRVTLIVASPPATYNQYFDLDGFDQVNLAPAAIDGVVRYDQLPEQQRWGIYEPTVLVISYDDDDPVGWAQALAIAPRIPVEGPYKPDFYRY